MLLPSNPRVGTVQVAAGQTSPMHSLLLQGLQEEFNAGPAAAGVDSALVLSPQTANKGTEPRSCGREGGSKRG